MATTLMNDISRMLDADISEVFTENFEAYPIEWPSFVTEKKSNKLVMKYDTMGNISEAYIKTESDNISYRKIQQAYQTSCTMKTIVNGICISLEAKTFDQYSGTSEAHGKELARTMREFEENRVIRWYDNVTTAAYALADGAVWATNSRPLYNCPGTFNDTYATTASLKTPENHKTMIKMFADFKNHAGGKIKAFPTDGLTHRYNMSDIQEVYSSDNKSGEFSNTKNMLPSIQWHYSTYMSDTNGWSMFDRRFPNLCFVKYMGIQKNAIQDVKDTLDFYYNVYEMFETCVIPNPGWVWNDGA